MSANYSSTGGYQQDWLDKFLGFTHGSPKVRANTGYLLFRIMFALVVVYSGVIFASIIVFEALEVTGCNTDTDTGSDDGGSCGNSSNDNIGDDSSSCVKLWGIIKPDSLLTALASAAGAMTAVLCPFVGTTMDFTPYRKHVGFCSIAIVVFGMLLCLSLVHPSETTLAVCTVGLFFVFVCINFVNMACDCYVPELSRDPYEIAAATSGGAIWLFLTQIGGIIFFVAVSFVVPGHLYGTVATGLAVMIILIIVPIAYDRLPHVVPARHIPAGQTIVSFSAARLVALAREVADSYSDLGLLFIANMVFDPALQAIFVAAILILVSKFGFTGTQVTIVLFLAILAAIPGALGAKWAVHTSLFGGPAPDSDSLADAGAHTEEHAKGQGEEHEGTVIRMKYALVFGLLSTTVTTFLAIFTMVKCDLSLGALYGVLWGASLAWCWNSSNMLRNALVPGGSEAEFSGLIFSSINLFAWLPTMIFTVANEAGSIDAAIMSLTGFFLVGAGIVACMDIPRGLHAREKTLALRRWAHDETCCPTASASSKTDPGVSDAPSGTVGLDTVTASGEVSAVRKDAALSESQVHVEMVACAPTGTTEV